MNNIQNNFQNSNEVYNFLAGLNINNPYAVTLTCKQRVSTNALDQTKLSINNRHFLNRLNTKLYGKKFTRYDKRLGCISVIESSESVRMHVHMILEKPTNINNNEFLNSIIECWNKTEFGYTNVDVKPVMDNGWLKYILKNKTKSNDLLSSIDWINTNKSS